MGKKLILGFITIAFYITACFGAEAPEAYFIRNNTNYNILLTKVLQNKEKNMIHRVIASQETCLFAESLEELNQISSMTFGSYGKLNGWFSKITPVNLIDIKNIRGTLAGFDINLSKFLTSYVISYKPLEITQLISEELRELFSKDAYNFTTGTKISSEMGSIVDKCFPGLASRGKNNGNITETDIARYVLGLGDEFNEEEFNQAALLTKKKWNLLMKLYQNQKLHSSSLITTNCKNSLNFINSQAEKIKKRYLNSYEILGVPSNVSKTDLIKALTAFTGRINSKDPSLKYYTVKQLQDIRALLFSIPI